MGNWSNVYEQPFVLLEKVPIVIVQCSLNRSSFSSLELDMKSEPCQRFFRDSLVTSFTKIFNDDAVQSWKYDIYVNDKFLSFVHDELSFRFPFSVVFIKMRWLSFVYVFSNSMMIVFHYLKFSVLLWIHSAGNENIVYLNPSIVSFSL